MAELVVKKPGLAYAAELLNAVDSDDDDETVAPIPLMLVTDVLILALLVTAVDVLTAVNPMVLAVCEVPDNMSGVTLNVLLRSSRCLS